MTKNQNVAIAIDIPRLAPEPLGPKSLYLNMLDSTPLLEGEDRNLYRQTFDAVASEVETESFLEMMQIKDYTDQVLGERRYQTMIVKVIEAATDNRGNPNARADQRKEHVAAKDYIGLVEPLARLAENSARARRMIQKELLDKKGKRAKIPAIVPEKKGPSDRE